MVCLPTAPVPTTSRAPASYSPPPHPSPSVLPSQLRGAQPSIPPGARGAPACNFPRVPSLKAFGRRPRCKPHRCDRPASETLNNSGRRGIVSFWAQTGHGPVIGRSVENAIPALTPGSVTGIIPQSEFGGRGEFVMKPRTILASVTALLFTTVVAFCHDEHEC